MKEFRIDITLEHGQLHESLNSEEDRALMIKRMDDILSSTSTDPEMVALRKGVAQILVDQLNNNDGHAPIIIRTGQAPDEEERLVWHCDHAKIKVKVDKYRETDRTPHKVSREKLFKFSNDDEGFDVHSTEYDDKSDAIKQKFYKFSVRGKDKVGNDLTLDPCVICEK
jgi:hypothetical protein